MFDPTNLPNYNMTKEQLEEFALFCVLVAGKTASRASACLAGLLNIAYTRLNSVLPGFNYTPFEVLGHRSITLSQCKTLTQTLQYWLKLLRCGCPTLKGKAIAQLVTSSLDLKTCTVQDLEGIYGIGPKTARFFILHTRKDANIACLDTHILRFMREELNIQTPQSTPSGKRYLDLELKFLEYAKNEGKTPAELDIMIWKTYTGYVSTEFK